MEDNLGKKEKQKGNWDIKPYLSIGLTAFIVIILSILVFFLIFRFNGLAQFWRQLMGILQPIIIGVAFAYLINPIVKFIEKHVEPLLEKRMKKKAKVKRVSRMIGIFSALVFVTIILTILLKMVIPELYASIERLVKMLPRQVENFIDWLNTYISNDSDVADYVEEFLNRGIGYFETWANTDFLPQTKNVISQLTSGVITLVKIFFNILVGIIVSVYVLISKETFVGQAKKLVYAMIPARKANVIVETFRKSNEILSGFISGKILDSAIIGVLCFIVLYILKMPYVVLVSVIVGVTNVIPFFGPYIGAVPSAILITLASPLQGLYFILFILILQQLDGNIIGPKILGESTGLSSFWVLFAILVGGGLFGFLGMILGVPVFAIFYYIVKRIVEHILKKKRLPLDTMEYTDAVNLDAGSHKLKYAEKPILEEKK